LLSVRALEVMLPRLCLMFSPKGTHALQRFHYGFLLIELSSRGEVLLKSEPHRIPLAAKVPRVEGGQENFI
jgi:hypothetical protein